MPTRSTREAPMSVAIGILLFVCALLSFYKAGREHSGKLMLLLYC